MRRILSGAVFGLVSLVFPFSGFSQDSTGACNVSGVCTEGTLVDCLASGGVYLGNGTSCTPVVCCGTDGTVFRGNANMIGIINVVDITYLVGCSAFGCFDLPCKEEAYFDGNGTVNIADLTALVANLFHNGPPPAMCP